MPPRRCLCLSTFRAVGAAALFAAAAVPAFALERVNNAMTLWESAPPAGSPATNLNPAPLPHAQQLGGPMSIVIVPGSTLAANAPALAAFNRAADQWASHFSDPIVVTINADLAPLGSSVIGDTTAVSVQGTYDEVRNQIALDGADEPSNAPITSALPTNANFSITTPPGRMLNPQIALTKANAKALGFPDVDAQFGVNDATMRFSSSFAFDYDRSNGVTPGTMDFQTVAAHEIGHVLGFISGVDDVNDGADPVQAQAMDLFRFAHNQPGRSPSNLTEFTTFPRDLIPGEDADFNDSVNKFALSTGTTNTQFPGTDGRQASHWKADELSGAYIGIMDPTLNFGQIEEITDADLRVMDLLGYDLAVPEPTGMGIGFFFAAATMRRRRPEILRSPPYTPGQGA